MLRHRLNLALFLSLLAFASMAEAANIRNTVLMCDVGSPCSTLAQSSTGPAHFDSGPAAPGGVHLFADTTTSNGALHAAASYTFDSPNPVNGQFSSNAEWFDSLTAESATTPDGTQAYLVPTFTLTGSASGPADAALSVIVFGAPPQVQTLNFTAATVVSFAPIPIIIGPSGTFNFEFGLSAEAFYGPGSGLSASSIWDHTATLTGFKAYLDPNVTIPITDVTFASASGTEYTANGVVPEPGSLFLAAGAIAFVLLRRRA